MLFKKKELDKEQQLARKLFKEMPLDEKASYIFRYYGVHIFLVVALILGVIMYINEYQENKRRENWLYFVTPEYYSDAIEAATDRLLVESNWKEGQEGLNYTSYATNDVESGFGNMQLMALLTADKIDYLVCDEVMCQMLGEYNDDEMNDGGDLIFDVVKLEETALGEELEFRKELYFVIFKDTARLEKVLEFEPILRGAAQDSQNDQIQP